MTDTLLRHWHMLREIPRAPTKIDAATLAARLSAGGFDVDVRSVQRDLHKLSVRFPLVCDELHKPYGWSWSRDAASFSAPGMDVHTAIAFRLSEAHLQHLLPETTRDYLQPWFRQARGVLDSLETNVLSDWPDKVRIIPQGQPLEAPAIVPEVLEAVQSALLRERQLLVDYRKRGDADTRRYKLHPLGLVYRDAVAYLVCTSWDFDDVLQFVLHRMAKAEECPEPRRRVPGFSLDTYIHSRAFDFLLGRDALELDALFEPFAMPRLVETPLSRDQVVVLEPDGRARVRAAVPDTVQLRTWLRGFGDSVEVVGPPSLRQEFAEVAERLARRYGADA